MDIITINARSKDQAESAILFYLNEIEKMKNGENSTAAGPSQFNSTSRRGSAFCTPLINKERALVVDGRTLT